MGLGGDGEGVFFFGEGGFFFGEGVLHFGVFFFGEGVFFFGEGVFFFGEGVLRFGVLTFSKHPLPTIQLYFSGFLRQSGFFNRTCFPFMGDCATHFVFSTTAAYLLLSKHPLPTTHLNFFGSAKQSGFFSLFFLPSGVVLSTFSAECTLFLGSPHLFNNFLYTGPFFLIALDVSGLINVFLCHSSHISILIYDDIIKNV